MVIAKAKRVMRATTNTAYSFWKLARPAHGREMVSATFANWLSTFGTWNIKRDLVVRFAQSFSLGWPTANRAFEFWPPATTTKLEAVLTIISRWRHEFAALLAIRCFAINFTVVPLAIMLVAESSSKMFCTTYFAKSWRSVNKAVFFNSAAKLKVFKSIVVADFVFMVNLFLSLKFSTKVLLHYQSMFLDVTTVVSSWVLWAFNHYISVMVFELLSRFSVWCSLHTERSMYR